ncbi:hypothetical protein [Streptomyces sp. enrichment culture]|uniref:hypothetical protein n=1 Tax=Streptomyces sp. enrichment culture TaxID=1795815 RepID=UPI003F555C81
MGAPEWLGDIPTWIGAGGAIGAAWFAYQTITSQRQQIGEQQQFIAEQLQFMAEQRQNLELERLEMRAVAEERRQAQARQVRVHQQVRAYGGDEYHWVLSVSNTSDEPIHDVKAMFGEQLQVMRVSSRTSPVGEHDVPVLGAGREAEFRSTPVGRTELHRHPRAILFTDSAGVRWQRTGHGRLTEASEAIAPSSDDS